MKPLNDFLQAHSQRFEGELQDFLRIASVSTDSRFVGEIGRAAQFVHGQLLAAGLDAEIIETQGHPLVYGQWLGAGQAPTVLIYGHYDVQPPDPLDEWETGPFEPTIRNGNIYARGATDDKGQMLTHLKALQAWREVNGRLPVNVKVLIEGEEEVGGQAIERYLTEHPQRLACDYAVVSDTSQFGPDIPAITYALRGISYFDVQARGPKRDLHSGSFGGTLQNPANAIAKLMAALTDDEGPHPASPVLR